MDSTRSTDTAAPEPTPRSDRPLDLVVFGATSFVGQILCRHLVERHGTDGALAWAIAGRDPAKLERVAADTGADVQRIVVDATDTTALLDMASGARVVVSTVGPYALYGSELVAAVCRAGTDYCDLTGEPQWMRAMIDHHHGAAVDSGARVVHACGFDSIPSDLGVWFTQQRALERFGAACEQISMRVADLKGAVSGGTLASMMNVLEEAASDRATRTLLADPYALAPPDARHGPDQREHLGPGRDPDGSWVAPFVMASVNTKVVQRSHALLGRPWGPNFRYDEATLTGRGPRGAVPAAAMSAGMAGFVAATSLAPVRSLLSRRILPGPGSGPSPAAQAAGAFDLRFTGSTAAGAQLTTRVTGDRDPGYGATARMLGEAAVELVDLPHAERAGGFWTPATAFGDRLVERLEAHAGMRFSVLP